MKKRVVVGISGGVDSAVAALLLKQQGYDVSGIFMRNWDSNLNNDFLGNKNIKENKICPQEEDYNDALKVCDQLNIPLKRVDFIKEYWNNVFLYFINEYKKGRTPNPDILCNKYIKFEKFLNFAFKNENCDYIAMGHYAGVVFNEKKNNFELLKANDSNKDQTYFLCKLNQDILSKTLFPLHKYNKEEIRKIAIENNLIVANKKDSTGICFIGERNFQLFLQNYIPNLPGRILDIKTNKKLGTHYGVMYYTIGQRKGLNLGGNIEPYYVAKKDVANKILYVSKMSDNSYLMSKSCFVENIDWIVDIKKYVKNINNFKCSAKFRYRQNDEKVEVIKKDDIYFIKFENQLRAITPGQEAVFYINDVCLGGGTICDNILNNENNNYRI